MMHLFYLLLVIMTQLCQHVAWADLCEVEVRKGTTNASQADLAAADELISCPRPEDPPESTACCLYTSVDNETEVESGELLLREADVPPCCAPDQQSVLFYFISDQVALLIAVSVTALLLVITIVIVICCFWSRCPLYMMCRVRYRQDDIIAYASKDDETTNLNDMPPEEQKGVTIYSPNAVKVTLKDDV